MRCVIGRTLVQRYTRLGAAVRALAMVSSMNESGWPWPSQRGFSRTAKFEKAAQDFHRIRFELFVTVCGKFTIHRSKPYRTAGNGAPSRRRLGAAQQSEFDPEANRCRWVFPPAPVRRMVIRLMKRIAHAISGIGEKPALLTEGGLLLCSQRRPISGSPGLVRIPTSARPPSRTGLAAARSVRRGSRSPPSSRGSRHRCSRSRPGSRSAC
jgi:hypothetical protein